MRTISVMSPPTNPPKTDPLDKSRAVKPGRKMVKNDINRTQKPFRHEPETVLRILPNPVPNGAGLGKQRA